MSKSTSGPTPLKIKMTRTIHPVGQGAFYSETFSNDDNHTLFTAVYDCGGKIENLVNQIETIPEVDILFISHFHADHIRGVNILINKTAVKKVVFPIISTCHFLIDYIYNCTKDNADEANLLMLKLRPWIISSRNGNGSSFRSGDIEYVPISEGTYDKTFISNNIPFWEYRVFSQNNKQFESKREGLLKKLISILGIPEFTEECMKREQDDSLFQKISNRFKDSAVDYKQLLNKVKQAYTDTFPGGHNSYSMIVLSHQIKADEFEIDNYPFDCLYTGDVEVDDCPLGIVTKYNPEYIQAPHHGSNNNHKADLYKYRPIAFMSAGAKSRYHHPGIVTLTDVLISCKEVHIVTDEYRSEFSRNNRIIVVKKSI